MNTKKFDLTQGDILKKLLLISLPVMGTSFVQMTHNLVDMFWLSRLSSQSVAAAGSGGMYLWLSMALLFIGRMGAEIGVSQNIGKGDIETAQKYSQNAFSLACILGLGFMLFLIGFHPYLVRFLNIQELDVIRYAEIYLIAVAFSVPFMYINAVFTGTFNGTGNTRMPFYINSSGLIVNIMLSPFLIFIMDMGLVGAAVATAIAQILMTLTFAIVMLRYKNRPFEKFRFFSMLDNKIVGRIFKWGIPIGIESALFTILTMISSRFVAEFGFGALAVQRVGSQIESLTWLIGGGFASAVTAFIGQNIGAKQYARVREGFKISVGVMLTWGIIVTLTTFIFAEQLISIFLSDPTEVQMGIAYLRIFAFMQISTCLEGVAAGSFRGRGLTMYPSIVSITCNATRVPLAFFLSQTELGLNGIWIAFTIGGAIRGFWMLAWYIVNSRKMPKTENEL